MNVFTMSYLLLKRFIKLFSGLLKEKKAKISVEAHLSAMNIVGNGFSSIGIALLHEISFVLYTTRISQMGCTSG